MMKTCGEKIKNLSYVEVRNIAYEALDYFDVTDFPINPIFILEDCANIKVFTYSEWAKKYNMRFTEVIDFAVSRDGCTTYDPVSNRYIILYNDRVNKFSRIKFTLVHEIAHIFLKHYEPNENMEVMSRNRLEVLDNPIAERQADMFAAEFLIPSCLVRYLPDEDVAYLESIFMTSREASYNALCRVNRICRKSGPNSLAIPIYLREWMYPYTQAISRKEYVELKKHRDNPEPNLKFDKRTGRYIDMTNTQLQELNSAT